MKKLKIILLLFVSYSKMTAQLIKPEKMERLINQVYLPYKDKAGNFLGCGYTFECRGMKVIFYEILLMQKEKKLIIKGRAIDPLTKEDSIGVQAVNIFLATPSGEMLLKIRNIAVSYARFNNDVHSNDFPYRDGDFYIQTAFGPNERLYFNSAVFKPIEYNIGSLLRK